VSMAETALWRSESEYISIEYLPFYVGHFVV
jgi:hypothetical protein